MCYEKNTLNVLETKLQPCSKNPLTGFYRDGYCKTFNNDVGQHIICSEMNEKFLNFSKIRGNDLITAVPEYNFNFALVLSYHNSPVNGAVGAVPDAEFSRSLIKFSLIISP